jgi:hypothetical protein
MNTETRTPCAGNGGLVSLNVVSVGVVCFNADLVVSIRPGEGGSTLVETVTQSWNCSDQYDSVVDAVAKARARHARLQL